MIDKNCLTCVRKCKEKIDPGFCYCDDWTNDVKDLTFTERAKLFKESIQRAEKKYGVEICAGYINSCDDSENLIIREVKRKDNIEHITNEVYFDTLKDYL